MMGNDPYFGRKCKEFFFLMFTRMLYLYCLQVHCSVHSVLGRYCCTTCKYTVYTGQ